MNNKVCPDRQSATVLSRLPHAIAWLCALTLRRRNVFSLLILLILALRVRRPEGVRKYPRRRHGIGAGRDGDRQRRRHGDDGKRHRLHRHREKDRAAQRAQVHPQKRRQRLRPVTCYWAGGSTTTAGSCSAAEPMTYSLATDPAANGGDYADVKLLSTSDTKGVMETHFSMLRGSPGFYSTAIMTHRRQDAEIRGRRLGRRDPRRPRLQLAERRRDAQLLHRNSGQIRRESTQLAARNHRQPGRRLSRASTPTNSSTVRTMPTFAPGAGAASARTE